MNVRAMAIDTALDFPEADAAVTWSAIEKLQQGSLGDALASSNHAVAGKKRT